MKRLTLIPLIALVIVILFTACSSESTLKSTSNTPNIVRSDGNIFTPSSLSIKKGNRITFVNDSNTGATFILAIGQNGQDESTNGSPDFGGTAGIRLDVGSSWTSPPWNTAGIYHVTCIVHPGMNLTVIVAN